MSYVRDLEKRVAEDVPKHLAKHDVKLLHGEGLYRHWRCAEPGTSNRYFDIMTWPGSLCYTGDMGDYLFQRTNDMVAFMRDSAMSFGYAAEKCVANDGRLEEWSEEIFHEALAERLQESSEYTVVRRGSKVTESVAEKIEEIKREYSNYQAQFDAEKSMYESGLWDGCDVPGCKAYTYHFLWCLHAIKWFCDKVNK